MTIISKIPGRIRLRDEHLTGAAYAEQMRNRLLAVSGVTSVEINRRTASLLVQYGPTASDVEDLLNSYAGLPQAKVAAKAATKQRSTAKKHTGGIVSGDLPCTYRQFLNYSMMATCAVSGIGIAMHYRKLHALAGFLFFGLSGLHMYNKRKTLFI